MLVQGVENGTGWVLCREEVGYGEKSLEEEGTCNPVASISMVFTWIGQWGTLWAW